MNDLFNGGASPVESFDPIKPEPVEQQPNVETVTLNRETMISELHAWCKAFVKASADWRRSSWEPQWIRWQRDADCIYDEAVAKKKEPWQSKVVWPLAAAHRENAQATLYKTELGSHPALTVKARDGIVPVGVPGADQSDNIKDLILREREKSRYEVGRNACLYDKTTYGSGFMQVYFDTIIEDRKIQEPIYEPIQGPWVDGGASVMRSMTGQRQVVGYKPVVKPSVIYRGVCARHINIWDVFPDPKSLDIPGNPIAIRYYTTYQDIIDGAKPTAEGNPGYVMPEAVEKLKDVASAEDTPIDKRLVMDQRNIVESRVKRTDYGKRLECYEIQAKLPKKWVLINGEEIDDPEALIPARIRFHDHAVITVMLNNSYDGEPDIYKDDYYSVGGQFYGIGIPEMVKDSQAVATESINMRLDSGKVALLNVYAVIEKSVVDPKDFTLGPGSVIRFKAKDGITQVDQAFKRVDMGSIDRNSFIEPQEWERAAHERTSITATTLGSEDNSQTTLGGQQIQQGVTSGKMAYLQMVSEFGFQRQIFKAYWKLIYQNYQPEDYALALGPERAATIVPLSPEQVENNYQYFPLGVMEQVGKATRQQQLAMIDQQFGMMPWFNRVEVAREEFRAIDQEATKFIIPEADAVQITMKAQQMAQGMVQQMQAQEAAKPEETKDEAGS